MKPETDGIETACGLDFLLFLLIPLYLLHTIPYMIPIVSYYAPLSPIIGCNILRSFYLFYLFYFVIYLGRLV